MINKQTLLPTAVGNVTSVNRTNIVCPGYNDVNITKLDIVKLVIRSIVSNKTETDRSYATIHFRQGLTCQHAAPEIVLTTGIRPQ